MRHAALVAAYTSKGGLGFEGRLPWHPRRLGLDLAFLQHITTHDYRVEGGSVTIGSGNADGRENVVVMGRKTWESLPARMRPLKGRRNVVVSRDAEYKAEGAARVCQSLEGAMSDDPEGPIYLLGGSGVYKKGMDSDMVECAFVTELVEHPDLPFDVEFPVKSLSRFEHRVNLTEQMFTLLKDKIKSDAEHRLELHGDDGAVYIDGDVSYRIMAYF